MNQTTTTGARAIALDDLVGDARRRRRETIVRNLFKGAAVASVIISAAIVASLVGKAMTFVTAVDLSALWSSGWFPRRDLFDIKTIVAGTLIITAIAMLVATPLGLGAALYLSEYAKPRVRRVLKPTLEILASIPSVVLGVFALTFISPDIVQALFSKAGVFNLLAAGLAVGVLVTPLVASISEDAMRSVPSALREASYGLGARKRSTVLKVVFPAALSGIVASLIIGISRAIGETMVVAIVAGGTGGSELTLDPTQSGQTMTGAMTALAIGSDQVRGSGNAFPSLFFVGLLLFLMTLGLNVLSERVVRRFRQRY
ncbi:MAG: phosphate ABC transporter permease subunit PstC [Actinomycetota bacterium]|nr:phosphate ABC transporter permease subunit PstC [Actinomycetota bacterium]